MRVGVVTPAFNVAATIGDTIASVIAQSHSDWAMVVVDDGSTDGTARVAESFADLRLRVVRQPNAGVSAARNQGMARLDCDAVVFLDGDDWLAPDALARMAAALTGSAVAAYGAYAFVDEAARPGAAPIVCGSRRLPSGDVLLALLERNLLANGGHALIRRDALARTGLFRTDLAFGEDWELWVRLALLGRFTRVPGPALLHVRRRRSGAYLRMASDPRAFDPCLDAIFGAAALHERLGPTGCARLRGRAEAERDWIVGRELIRHGSQTLGRDLLRRAVLAKPLLKRLALLATLRVTSTLRPQWRGPFRPYPPAPEEPRAMEPWISAALDRPGRTSRS